MPVAGRSTWKGAIVFGIVTVPVRAITATTDRDLSFHRMHTHQPTEVDGKAVDARPAGRLKQSNKCEVCFKEIANGDADVMRGFEYAKGQNVILTDEDFEAVPLKSRSAITIESFAPIADVDPVYFEKAYALEPEELGVKGHAMIVSALLEKNLVGIGKLAMRQKEQVVVLRALDGQLLMHTLMWHDEVKVRRGEPVPDVGLSEQERGMAGMLVDMLTKPFDPAAYHDEYREALQAVIQTRLAGKDYTTEAAPAEQTQPIDLMAALAQMLETQKAAAGVADVEPFAADAPAPAKRSRSKKAAA